MALYRNVGDLKGPISAEEAVDWTVGGKIENYQEEIKIINQKIFEAALRGDYFVELFFEGKKKENIEAIIKIYRNQGFFIDWHQKYVCENNCWIFIDSFDLFFKWGK